MALKLNSLSWGLVEGQLILLAVMVALTVAFNAYRKSCLARVKELCKKQGTEFGVPLMFHAPDSVPRHFKQYAYRSSPLGTLIIYSWVFLPLAGYVVMVWGCYIAYVISDGIYFPPSAKYWKDTFGSWNGLMMPWCVWFTIVHLVAGIASKFFSTMGARSMLPCASMKDATHLIVDEDHIVDPDNVHDPDEEEADDTWVAQYFARMSKKLKRASTRQVLLIRTDSDNTRYVEYTCVRYVYDETDDAFIPKGLIEVSPKAAHELLAKGGLREDEAAETLTECGPNSIHVHVPGILEALGTEFSDFTYIFNSVGTWAYVAYSTWNIGFVWLAMIAGSGIYRALFIIRPNQKKIAEMAAMSQKCTVIRSGRRQEIEAHDIALGDIVEVMDGENAKLPCDGILVKGSLIVNESMLTGEPMPIAKAPVENSAGAVVTDKLNKAYAGTLALESTSPDGGKSQILCTNVGALTTRGQLVRMVLFPASVKFKYNDQLPIVYGIMSIYVTILVLILVFCTDLGSAVALYLTVLCTIAMSLNPMLPVSMVMGQTVSAGRLDDPNGPYQIKCLQPGRIPIAGKISTMVFDKTGTITKGGMDFAAVQVLDGSSFRRVAFDDTNPECEANRLTIADPSQVPVVLRDALVSCHTVKQLKSGSLVGNQVECAMVRTTGWRIEYQQMVSPAGEAISVWRELEFDHHRMTSGSVVAKDGRSFVFIKGSYEKVKAIAHPASVPPGYDQVTMQCAKDNYYTLGIAFKELPPLTKEQVQGLSRDDLERDVSIIGLLLFRNEMKADSPEAIEQLKAGSIRSVICTGDNELTGIAIGRKCGIVTSSSCLRGNVVNGRLEWTDPDKEGATVSPESPDPFCQLALTCSAWRHLHTEKPGLLEELWPRCVIFARMKPDDKINVVKYLQGRGLVVGMAGDGGNDCGGLRAAHAGIALSDAEASMVSPFSTGRLGKGAACNDISLTTVPDLIREGRACLATNLATFMYFMVYAFLLTTIRTAFLVLATLSLGEWVWLTMDLGIGVVMMFFMTKSHAKPTLAHYRPTATLLGLRTISGIMLPYLLSVICLIVGLVIVKAQPWYDPLNPTFDIHVLPRLWMKKGDNYDSPIGVLLLFSVLSTTAYVNTYGGDFRQAICKNIGINIVYALFMFATFFLVLSNPNKFNCIYRVNCDTQSSLACKSIPVLSQYSVGGTGGCFLGPQVKPWQNYTDSYWVPKKEDEPYWLPDPADECLPPQKTLDKIPLDSKTISTGMGFRVQPGCIGPNNCYGTAFKWIMSGIILVYIAIHHGFQLIVLLGPVAAKLRRAQRHQDKEKLHGQVEATSSSGSSEGESDDSLL
eukprot:TRINITY_DN22565_c0_g1_i1.p1 TRINITY_DN22565_c0_g1~~TRINITY_DN22565_c0_g1_i1.p1  ORF type:complete len:1348 (+),score=245.05 TRINITY_DN22565_c0_g1_i1:60-4046(+)